MANERVTLRSQITGMAFAAPSLIGMAVFLIFPLAMSLYLAFTDYSMLNHPMPIGTDNFTHLLGFHHDSAANGALVANDPIFYQVLRNTLLFGVLSVPITLTASILLAVLLNQSVPGRPIFRTIIFLPSLVPAVAAAMLWLWVLNGKQGLLNVVLTPLLHPLGFTPPNWLGNENFIIPIFVLLGLFGIGNTVVIFLAGLQDIPAELYESAQIDGASAPQRLRHITLPMLSPVIFFNLIMGIIGVWQVFTLPYIMAPGGGPNRSGYFYSAYLFDSAFMQQRMGYASAMAWIQFLIIFALTMLTIWLSKRFVHYR